MLLKHLDEKVAVLCLDKLGVKLTPSVPRVPTTSTCRAPATTRLSITAIDGLRR